MQHTGAGLLASVALIAMVSVGGCTTARETSPDRTATEQLLISTAVDRAVERMDLNVPTGTMVFVDAGQLEGSDGKYAAGVIKERLLRDGAKLVADRGRADAIVEVRAGALSIDDKKTLIGTDSFDVPIPFAGQPATIPEIALYRQKERAGVVKLAAISYRTSDGEMIDATGPQFGYSHENEEVILFLFSRRSSDLPKEKRSGLLDFD